MAVGRISGPLLKANLLRNGIDLAFENDLLYLDVINGRVGIKTASPTTELEISGTTRTTDLEVTNQADIATFTILGNTISSSNGIINLEPAGSNPVVYQGKIVTGDLQLSTNVIETTTADVDLNISTLGTGKVNVNSNMLVNGDLHVTGNLKVDGDTNGLIEIGDSDADSVEFKAEINSNIIPDDNVTWDLGSDPLLGGKAWRTAYIDTVNAETINASSVIVGGVDLTEPQGNILYVSTNGSDSALGNHEHSPFLTIKHALSQATSGYTVFVYPGTYTETFPITIPVGVTLKGAGIRAVVIQPTVGSVDKDALLLNGETTVEDLTITGFKFNQINNTGYGFRFAPGFSVTSRSPYIRNITVITRGSTVSPSDPYGFDSADAGKGALVDGSIASTSSKEASMLFHSCTFFTPNQECIIATNGVRIEWLNSFTYFAEKGLYLYAGNDGLASQGVTRVRIDSQIGTWSVGDTLSYYDTDGVTLLADGVISEIDGTLITMTDRRVGFETITDRAPKSVSSYGDAKLSTAIKKFGTASLALDGTGDYATLAVTPDFGFGTANFTIEFWVYRNNSALTEGFLDFKTANPQNAPNIYAVGSNLYYFVNGSPRITGTSVIGSSSTWYHIAVSRDGTDTRMFVNGTQVGSTWTDSTNYISAPLVIGNNYVYTAGLNGYIDDLRISKGVARYTTTFVAPTTALTGDLNTVLLLHFNGANNSTTIIDDGITLQDLRTTSGGTASVINFADYSDFGAELRSIGSACIYGTYGAYGDGAGVTAYLISHNFAYIGAGKLTTNDPNDRIAANEVTELAGARIYYTGVDNEGNFSVGDAFFVNQKTGDVLFGGQSLSITALEGVTFTDGTNNTTITPVNIDTGNIRISGNTVESVTGALNVVAASGEINLQSNTFISGNLDVTGDLTLGGNITIGNESTDTINFVGGINSNLIPATSGLYDLGTLADRWANIFVSRAEIDGLVIDNNTISTTIGNDDLTLEANGSGRVYIPSSDVEIDQNLTVTQNLTVSTGTTYLKATEVTGDLDIIGNINQTGDFTTSGNTDVTGNITGTGYLQLPVITVSGNTISTTTTNTDLNLQANGTGNVVVEGLEVSNSTIQATTTNADITLTPQGTGSVVINSNQSIQIPVGGTADRPDPAALGMIRYNTDLDQYEGWTGSYWLTLSGIKDADGNTYITPELTPGANDNTLRFYADGTLMVSIDTVKMFIERLQTATLDIQNNIITTIDANADIVLSTTGTGGVKVGSFIVKGNTITNTVTGAITEFVQTGTGYVKISGTNGVVIPAGDTANDRPQVPETGMMRFNTAEQLVEVYNGTIWTSVAGTSGGITIAEAEELGIVSALLFG